MQEYLNPLLYFLDAHQILAPFIFILLRAIAVIFPPIPGFLIDLGGITTLPWFLGFISSETGLVLGAMSAFWIARILREQVLRRFMKSYFEKVMMWEDDISEQKKFWGLVFLRIPSSGIFDYMSYAAGLTKISAARFFFATLIGSMPGVFLVYYFGGILLRERAYLWFLLFAILFVLFATFFGKKLIHYLTREHDA